MICLIKTIGNRCIYKEVPDNEAPVLVASETSDLQSEVTLTQRVDALENAVAESLDILKNLVAGENNV